MGGKSNQGYPPAERQNAVELLHGCAVADPYRWLEEHTGTRTKRWLAAQEELWTRERAKLTGVTRFAETLSHLHNVGQVGLPVWRGTRWFGTGREPGQEVNALYTGSASGDHRILVDPNAHDHMTLDGFAPDHEGNQVAYEVSRDGTEEPTLWITDVTSGAIVDGPIDRTRHGSIGWLPGGRAFYYTRQLPQDLVPAGERQYHHRVYLHRVGTPPHDDVLVFGERGEKTTLYRLSVSADGRWFTISSRNGAAPYNDIWIADLNAGGIESPDLKPVCVGLQARTDARIGWDGRLYLLTDLGAPRYRLAVADPAKPEPQAWTDLLAEDAQAVLTDFALVEGDGRAVVVAARSRHAIGEIIAHDARTGEQLDQVGLPGLGTVGGLAAHPDPRAAVWISYTDVGRPRIVLSYDTEARTVDSWWQPPGVPDIPPVDSYQLSCRSADGTTVRVLLLAAAGTLPDPCATAQPRPTLLYGYGGFNVSLTPAYQPAALAWAEAGGIVAMAAVRGGGEEGQDWHRAGMRENKQNSFADFVAVAEHLISTGWTSPNHLCISGGSNGGLLVGATITQRPELFAAALCRAPLLDMVRYERFGLGRMWTDEYGSAKVPEQLRWLLSYSPYHRVHPGVAYPAVLFSTFDSDTRVDPMHAWKMCAALQHASAAPERPVVLRRASQLGHGERAMSRTVALSAEALAFAARYTGLRW